MVFVWDMVVVVEIGVVGVKDVFFKVLGCFLVLVFDVYISSCWFNILVEFVI